jgi:hypothetical protein
LRILELVKEHPKSSTGALEQMAPKVHKTKFNAALERLAKKMPTRIKDALGGVYGDRKPKEWVAI